MIQARTYYCGRNGGVRKLVDLAGLWIDVSLPANGIPASAASELFDVEVDPNVGDKVFVVGNAQCDVAGWFGIGVSSNGGVSWQVPGGNYQGIVGGTGASPCLYKWYEITIVDSNVSYVCGALDSVSGKPIVIKSTDGGLTFNTCAPLPVQVDGMDATCIHFVTPLIGVVSFSGDASGQNYVIRTMDGGATWLVMNNGAPLTTSNPFPGSPLVTGGIYGIYISDDLGYIIGASQTMIVETAAVIFPNPPASAGVGTDSWQNNYYTNFGGFNGLNIGYHVSYIKTTALPPFDAGLAISGYSSLGITTGDRGGVWTNPPAPGYDPSGNGFNRVAAHFFTSAAPPISLPQRGFYNKDSVLYYNGNGFNPGLEAVSDNSPYGINAVWTWYQDVIPPTPCYKLTECSDPANIIVTSTNLGPLIGQIVTLSGTSGCFLVSDNPDCVGSIPVTVTNTYSSCLECNPPCYKLSDCASVLPDIITSSNLTLYLGQIVKMSNTGSTCWTVSLANNCSGSIPLAGTITVAFPDCISCSTICYYLSDCSGSFPVIHTNTDVSAYLGKTVTLNNYPGICWMVTQASDCTGSSPLTSTIVNNYVDCIACLEICYRLVDCTGTKPDIITNADLTAFVGQVIKIVGCDSVCYIVSKSDSCLGSISIEVSTSFGTCELCIGAPKKYMAPLKTRMIQPNYGEGNCSVDIVEKTNCKYANQVYAKYLSTKFGVNACIDKDFDKWLVKKRLLELNLIYDPTACIVPPVLETCPDIPVVPPVPVQCLPATSVVATFSDPLPTSCGTPVVTDVEIVYQSP